MPLWRKNRFLLAGLALILAANAVVFLGVAYNRSGQPESQVVLSQRELAPPYLSWRYRKEESGVWLTLQPRILPACGGDSLSSWTAYSSGSPEWLGEEKLRELGLDLPDADTRQRYSRREWKKEVLLVLEMNGSLYQSALQRARNHLDRERDLAAAHQGDAEFERRLKSAEDAFKREEEDNSRLFVADAGLDATALRDRYPERDRHVIVRGLVYPILRSECGGEPAGWAGYVGGIENDRINVPLEARHTIEAALATGRQQAVFEAEIAFGKRFEPWLVSVTATSGQ